MMLHKIIIVVNIIPLIATTVLASSVLYVGQTFDFAEQDMIETIQSHIKNNEKKIEKKFEEYKQQSIDKIEQMQPKLTHNLPYAVKNRVFFANTKYVNPEDVKDAKGKILYRKGYTYDPMDYIYLPYSVVFINADRPKEIEWLKQSNMLDSSKFRILLTSGKYSEATKTLGQHVFFAKDNIIERMNIQATPSIASQEGNKLKITEVCLDCNKTE